MDLEHNADDAGELCEEANNSNNSVNQNDSTNLKLDPDLYICTTLTEAAANHLEADVTPNTSAANQIAVQLPDGTHVLCQIISSNNLIIDESELLDCRVENGDNTFQIDSYGQGSCSSDGPIGGPSLFVDREKLFACTVDGCSRHAPSLFVDGRKRFLCNVDGCDRHYASRSSLKTHQRLHTGVRPFVCKTCAKTFNTSYSLKTHVRTHTGQRPFK